MVAFNAAHRVRSLVAVAGIVMFTLVAAVLIFATILIDPPRVLLACFVVYALSGPVAYLWRRRRTGAWTPTRSGAVNPAGVNPVDDAKPAEEHHVDQNP